MHLRPIDMFARLIALAVSLIAAKVTVNVAQLLAGIGIGCAACVDPSQAMSVIGLAGGNL